MRSLLIAAFFFPVAMGAAAGPRHCTFRVHITGNADDTAVFAQPIRSLSGRDVFIDKTPWLSERDVKAFCPYRAADGSYAALLQLDDHGRTILDTLSVEHRGSFLFVFVNGRPLTELQVDRRVSDGTVYLPSGLTEADIRLMNKDLKLLGRQKKK
jgi:hypothetical protein